MKSLGPLSMEPLLRSLGVCLILSEDPKSMQRHTLKMPKRASHARMRTNRKHARGAVAVHAQNRPQNGCFAARFALPGAAPTHRAESGKNPLAARSPRSSLMIRTVFGVILEGQLSSLRNLIRQDDAGARR
jgi:hypothetical protein